VYDARLIFHITLPDWDVNFHELFINCLFHVNISISEQCLLMGHLRRAIWETYQYNQRYIQGQVKCIYEVILDLPIGERDRKRRGVMADILSRVTGLASKDDVQAVIHILEHIQTGV